MARLLLLAALASSHAKKHHKNNTELTIAFTSDLHGEIAPLKHASAIYASLPEPKLLVDSGDSYIGTGYFRRAGPAGMGRVMRALGYAVLGVGNHDLELAASFRNFSATAKAPLVSTNLCGHYDSIKCSSVIEVGDLRIGFVGYCDTSALGPAEWRASLPKTSCDAKMTDRVIEEAVKLKSTVHIVVALGYCGYDFDVEIAKSPVIDAVVGGHTHLVRHRSSFNDRPVVLQAGAAASHLGVLRLSLARRKGNVTVEAARSATRRRE